MLFTERCNQAIYFVNVSLKSNESHIEIVSNLFVVAQFFCVQELKLWLHLLFCWWSGWY